ncbi:MAG: phosphodiester glycosidase family protein [Bacillota bacterium]|nr:phosphodiester glycosidase family protein [Bacillota bacterium]
MKRLLSLISALIFILTVITALPVLAEEIYKYEETTPIVSGVTLTRVQKFYSDHNLSYSYITADLSKDYLGLTLLKSKAGADKLDTVSNLAKTEDNVVSAINADFFSVYSGTTGFSLGLEVKDGKLLQSPIDTKAMAGGFYSKDGVLNLSSLSFHVMAVAPNSQYTEIRHINKHTSYYGDILMFTSDFNGGNSPAPGGEVVEVVVENGIIKEFRRNMPSVKVPENGCILAVSEGSSMFLANNFKVGDPIRFDYYVTPSLDNIDTAFGGGTMLVSQGKIPAFTHTISGYQPRSAVGTDKTGKIIHIVSVDGRQAGSRGMTQTELANFMLELGCYNALNLDGGGSANMVASTVWDSNLHTVNSPTENRSVVNALGITSSLKAGEAFGIKLKADKDCIYIGDSVNISSTIYDSNNLKVDGQVAYTATLGTVNNGVFTSGKAGTAVITASYKNITQKIEIKVLDQVCGISLDPVYTLSVGEEKAINVKVFDEQGHYIPVNNLSTFNISVSDEKVASVKDGKLRGLSGGTAQLKISQGSAVSYAKIKVGTVAKEYTDDFENLNGMFASYPAYVGGEYDLSYDMAKSGDSSGKLSFDFTADAQETKAAYITLNKPLTLSDSCKAITLSYYLPENYGHSLRAQFTDGKGEAYRLVLDANPVSGSWQTITASIPDTAVRPLTLTKLYIVQTDYAKANEGCVYFDDLSLGITSELPDITVPQNVYADSENKASVSGHTFGVGAISTADNTIISRLSQGTLYKSLAALNSAAVVGGYQGSVMQNGLKVVNSSSFSSVSDGTALYLSLDTSKGGIQATSSAQWDSLAAALKNAKEKYIFILSDNPIESSSELENKVLYDFLGSYAQSKNINVICKGGGNTLTVRNNVRYFTITDFNHGITLNDKANNYCYLEFMLNNDSLSYQWKKIWK